MTKFFGYFTLLGTVFLIMASSSAVTGQNLSNPGKMLFDYDWKFNLGDNPGASAPNYDDTKWRNLDLPHDWSIEGKIDAGNPTGNDGGYFPAGIGWYRKAFHLPAAWKGKQLGIYFEGVYMDAEVFINGVSLGMHPYGYTSFSYDLTPYLKYGQTNTLSVRVDNSRQKNCRWYSGSGIYRHVWLTLMNKVHVDNWGVGIFTEKASSKNAIVKLRILLNNETDKARFVQVNIQLLAPDGKKAGADQKQIKLQPHSSQSVQSTILVTNPLLWAPETPQLYQAQVQVVNDKQVADKVTTPFGIRYLSFTAENGFQLNGKTIKLNGGCMHHDNGCLGAAAYDRAEERKVELLKAAGFNAVRTSHNPPSEAFLNACDKAGMLVIDESFDGWRTPKNKYDYSVYFDQWWKRDLTAMVKRDLNHPSIIMWSIGNEIIERKEPQAVNTAKMLTACVHNLDATRPVTSAMTTWDHDWEIFDPLMAAHDVCGYNYQLHRAAADHQRVPSRVIVQTESYPRDAFANWELVQNNKYVIGDFVWTAMDYLGESGIGRYYYPGEPEGQHWEKKFFPWHGAYCGNIDLTGWRKPVSHYRSLLYNDNEKIYLAVREPNPPGGEIKETMWSVWPTWESWTWPGYEGKNLQVEIYSKYPKVRLYLNDKIIGELVTDREHGYKATFTLPYAPGILKGVGVENGKEIVSTTLKTAGDASNISLTPDRKKITPNGQDLAYVTIEITDKNGVVNPNSEHLLSVNIKGEGTIAGMDNANLKDPDTYVSHRRKTWHGRALVVVKTTRKPGDIILTVSSPGLPDATLLLKSLNRLS